MLRKISTIFVQGLMAILPIALTIYVLYWLGTSAESLLGSALHTLLGEKFYVPGMGVLAGFIIILIVGLLMRNWVFQGLLHSSEHLVQRIPIVKSIYNSIRDLTGFFDASKKKEFNKVVMVDFPNLGKLMGLVTREDFSALPANIGDEETISVYLPMSYQIGGFTVMVPRSRLSAVDMTIEEAMRFTLTAAMSTGKEPNKDQNNTTATL